MKCHLSLYVHHVTFPLMCWCGHGMFVVLVKAPFIRSCSASLLNGINSQVKKEGQMGCMDSPLTADNRPGDPQGSRDAT